MIEKGEYACADEKQVLCRLNVKQSEYTKVDETAMMKRIIDDPQTDKEYARIKKLEEENAMLKAELKPLAPGKYLVN